MRIRLMGALNKGLAALMGAALMVAPINLISQERTDSTDVGLKHDQQRTSRMLNVPFVAQPEALCGGAAAAMVLRYWDKTNARAEDFAAFVRKGKRGIVAGELIEAVQSMGWQTIPFTGTIQEVQTQISQGRPLIALIQSRRNRYHYVVVIGWTHGHAIIHDPARGPFRVVRHEVFMRSWAATHYWTLLILPPHQTRPEAITTDSGKTANGTRPYPDECGQLVREGVQSARKGDLANAEIMLSIAHDLCPSAGAPLRELASIRFRQKRWNEASQLAKRAVALEPEDTHAWRLLATNRFLDRNLYGALRAWNRIGEPRIDVINVQGQRRTHYAVVTSTIDLPGGALLTPERLRRAQRRLSGMPVVSNSRIGYRPLRGGKAAVEVAVQERPLFIDSPLGVIILTAHAFLERELILTLADVSGFGDASTLSWRWWNKRPRLSLVFEVPQALGLPGILRIESFWERQAFEAGLHSSHATLARAAVIREERNRTAVGLRDWITADLFWETTAALDRWYGRGTYIEWANAVELRTAGDRLALRAAGGMNVPLKLGSSYLNGMIGLHWRSDPEPRTVRWFARGGMIMANTSAPLSVWPRADNRCTQGVLLRAHPFLRSGVIEHNIFGHKVAYSGCEVEYGFSLLGLFRLSLGPFVDMAKIWNSFIPTAKMPIQVDTGLSARLNLPGQARHLRIDVARNLINDNVVLAATFESRWPYW